MKISNTLSQVFNYLGLRIFSIFSHFNKWWKKYYLYEVGGAKFKVRSKSSDKFPIREVFIMKDYTKDGFDIKHSDIVVDIGGHIGSFSVFAGRKAKKVFTYEPNKENYNLLLENIKLNNLKNVKAHNLAISDKKGKTPFFLATRNFGGSSIYQKTYTKKKTVVKTITLKDIFIQNKLKKIDFLKLDAEGAEYKILFSNPKYVQKINKISIEVHDNIPHGYNYRDLMSFLEKNGFIIRFVSPSLIKRLFRIVMLRAERKVKI